MLGPLRRRKNARRCGVKHISKSKWHTGFGPLWTLRRQKEHTAVARSTFRSQHVKSTPPSDHFWTFNRATPHYSTATVTTNYYSYNYNNYYSYKYHYTTTTTAATTTTTMKITITLQFFKTTLHYIIYTTFLTLHCSPRVG